MRKRWGGLGFRVGPFFSFAFLSLLRMAFFSLQGVWDGWGVNIYILHGIPCIGWGGILEQCIHGNLVPYFSGADNE